MAYSLYIKWYILTTTYSKFATYMILGMQHTFTGNVSHKN